MKHSFMVDFARTTKLDYRQTLTRASSGYILNRSGILENIAANKPRFEYDNSTTKCLGILIEPESTNICLRSQELNSAGGWTQNGLTTATVSNAGAPDGTSTVSLLTENTTNAAHGVYRSLTATVAQNWVGSFYALYVDRTNAGIYLVDNGATTNYVRAAYNINTLALAVSGGVNNGILNNSGAIFVNGWTRLWTAGQPNTSGTAVRAYVYMIENTVHTYTGTSTSLKAWGVQLEAGVVPTSYIPTTTGSATRNADVLTQSLNPSWFSATEGTILISFKSPIVLSGTQTVLSFDDGTANEIIQLKIVSGVLYASITDGGVEVVSLNLGTLTTSTIYTVALMYKLNDFAATLNGATPVTSSSGTLPTVTTLRYGSNYSNLNQLCGSISRMIYWPKRRTNSDMQQLTLQ